MCILDQGCNVLSTKDSLVPVAANKGEGRGVQDLEGKKSKKNPRFPIQVGKRTSPTACSELQSFMKYLVSSDCGLQTVLALEMH